MKNLTKFNHPLVSSVITFLISAPLIILRASFRFDSSRDLASKCTLSHHALTPSESDVKVMKRGAKAMKHRA